MSDSRQTKRPTCAACLRPARTCICGFVAPVDSLVELLILQHPLETSSAKGSARLLHLCVQGSRMVVGEVFDEEELRGLLHAGGRHPVLLYPETPDERSLGLPSPPPFDPGIEPGSLRLVVLDGTWRKSRKMLYLNPLLQALPRLPLKEVPASLYRIRKAQAPDQLSSLEASCYALAQLDGDAAKYQPVLDAFERFVGQYEDASRSNVPAAPRPPAQA